MQVQVFRQEPWEHFFSEHLSESESYATALYWAGMTLTTIGYGDIYPATSPQRIYVTCVMLIGGFLYGYLIAAISAVLGAAGERRHQFITTMNKLNHFLDNQLIPTDLRYKLREYFRCVARLVQYQERRKKRKSLLFTYHCPL
jgi:hypothetical protein